MFKFLGFNPMLSEYAEAGAEAGEDYEAGAEEEDFAEPLEEEEGAEEEEVADLPETSKSDAAFAELRRRAEEAERRAQEAEDALGLWFEGDNKAAQALAHYEDISLDEAIDSIQQRRDQRALEEEATELRNELDQLRFNELRAQDLKAIKEAIPDAKINDVLELGEDFFKYRTMDIDPVTAYEAIQMKKGVPPKSMGKARTSAPAKSGYYTRDEVASMSPAEISKNFDKIRKSMGKW